MKKLIAALCLIALIFPFSLKAADHGALTSIELPPLLAQVKAGENLALTLTAKDTSGLSWDISQNAVYQTNDPRGKMENNIYSAGKIGTWEISAVYGNHAAQTTVQVLPGDLATIIVNPNSQPEIIDLGSQKTFTAEGFDKMSNLLAGLAFNWSADGLLGDINEKGVFGATDTGEGRIIASINSVTGFSAIKVKEKTLLPSIATVIPTPVKPKTNTNAMVSNTNGQVAGAEIAAAAETAKAAEVTTAEKTCKTFAWYWWALIMIGFFAILILYYFFIRRAKAGWWWIFPLILTAAVVWLYYQYACNKYGWWPWVTIIMAILISLFRPKKYFEEPKTPTF